jgi:hypothetical protein
VYYQPFDDGGWGFAILRVGTSTFHGAGERRTVADQRQYEEIAAKLQNCMIIHLTQITMNRETENDRAASLEIFSSNLSRRKVGM